MTRWPRAWPTLMRLALGAAPGPALRALWTVLRGKRVRGWNLLYLVAADHPSYYAQWVRRGEPRIIKAFLAGRHPGNLPFIGCIIFGTGDDADAKRTLASVRRALPATTPIWTDATVLGGENVTPTDALDYIAAAPDWLLPLKAGDLVSPMLGDVLRHAAPELASSAVVFWDEDIWRDGCRKDPWIKPDWDPILFGAREGLTGAALIKGTALLPHGSYHEARSDAAGFARLVRDMLASGSVIPQHIPLILTHRVKGTTFVRRAKYEQADALNSAALVPVTLAIWPTVSIIIPTRDRADLLATCLAGLDRLAYPGKVEILIVDNDSVEDVTSALFARAKSGGAKVIRYPGKFNYAGMINHAAKIAHGEMLCLLNNDIEFLDGDWLRHMVCYAALDRVGAVGARLLYPSGKIQHAGVAIGIGGAAGHVQKGIDPIDLRFADWHAHSRAVSAVTGACLVVALAKFDAAGRMDAERFPVDFNDVDFCMRLGKLGLINVFAAEATMVHHESESRGKAHSPASAAQFKRELELLHSRWQTRDFDDPHYSPLFRRESERCVLAF